jgi:hypothetical protein
MFTRYSLVYLVEATASAGGDSSSGSGGGLKAESVAESFDESEGEEHAEITKQKISKRVNKTTVFFIRPPFLWPIKPVQIWYILS